MNPKISVIMGVYNSNIKYLCNAIESVLAQSFKDFEFIICDDCSTDEYVRQILREFEIKDERIHVIKSSVNSGLASALNECLNHSKGVYIARMDDDDISATCRFEKQVVFLDKNSQYDFVGSNICLIDDDQHVWGHVKNKEKPVNNDFLFSTPFTHPTIMVRREAYERVGGYRVNRHTRRTEDYDLFMRMYAKGLQGYNFQEELYFYYMNKNTYKKQKFKYRIDEMIVRYEGFKKLDLLPKGLPYVVKPLISFFVPSYFKMKRNK